MNNNPLTSSIYICRNFPVAKYVDCNLVVQKNPNTGDIPPCIVFERLLCCKLKTSFLTIVQYFFHEQLCTTIYHMFVGVFIGVVSLQLATEIKNVDLIDKVGKGYSLI